MADRNRIEPSLEDFIRGYGPDSDVALFITRQSEEIYALRKQLKERDALIYESHKLFEYLYNILKRYYGAPALMIRRLLNDPRWPKP